MHSASSTGGFLDRQQQQLARGIPYGATANHPQGNAKRAPKYGLSSHRAGSRLVFPTFRFAGGNPHLLMGLRLLRSGRFRPILVLSAGPHGLFWCFLAAIRRYPQFLMVIFAPMRAHFATILFLLQLRMA